MKEKEFITADFQQNLPGSRKINRSAQYQDIEEAVYDWYLLARERLISVTGPMLQEEALFTADGMEHADFKATNGWLQRFKERHNIRQLVVSGEADDVAAETIEA